MTIGKVTAAPPAGDSNITRGLLIEENDASDSYESAAAQTDDSKAKDLFHDISREEKVHAGELNQLLDSEDPENAEAIEEGRREAADKVGGHVSEPHVVRPGTHFKEDRPYREIAKAFMEKSQDPNAKEYEGTAASRKLSEKGQTTPPKPVLDQADKEAYKRKKRDIGPSQGSNTGGAPPIENDPQTQALENRENAKEPTVPVDLRSSGYPSASESAKARLAELVKIYGSPASVKKALSDERVPENSYRVGTVTPGQNQQKEGLAVTGDGDARIRRGSDRTHTGKRYPEANLNTIGTLPTAVWMPVYAKDQNGRPIEEHRYARVRDDTQPSGFRQQEVFNYVPVWDANKTVMVNDKPTKGGWTYVQAPPYRILRKIPIKMMATAKDTAYENQIKELAQSGISPFRLVWNNDRYNLELPPGVSYPEADPQQSEFAQTRSRARTDFLTRQLKNRILPKLKQAYPEISIDPNTVDLDAGKFGYVGGGNNTQMDRMIEQLLTNSSKIYDEGHPLNSDMYTKWQQNGSPTDPKAWSDFASGYRQKAAENASAENQFNETAAADRKARSEEAAQRFEDIQGGKRQERLARKEKKDAAARELADKTQAARTEEEAARSTAEQAQAANAQDISDLRQTANRAAAGDEDVQYMENWLKQHPQGEIAEHRSVRDIDSGQKKKLADIDRMNGLLSKYYPAAGPDEQPPTDPEALFRWKQEHAFSGKNVDDFLAGRAHRVTAYKPDEAGKFQRELNEGELVTSPKGSRYGIYGSHPDLESWRAAGGNMDELRYAVRGMMQRAQADATGKAGISPENAQRITAADAAQQREDTAKQKQIHADSGYNTASAHTDKVRAGHPEVPSAGPESWSQQAPLKTETKTPPETKERSDNINSPKSGEDKMTADKTQEPKTEAKPPAAPGREQTAENTGIAAGDRPENKTEGKVNKSESFRDIMKSARDKVDAERGQTGHPMRGGVPIQNGYRQTFTGTDKDAIASPMAPKQTEANASGTGIRKVPGQGAVKKASVIPFRDLVHARMPQ